MAENCALMPTFSIACSWHDAAYQSLHFSSLKQSSKRWLLAFDVEQIKARAPLIPETGNRKTKKPAYLLALIIGPDWPVREDSNLRPLAPRTYSEKKPASILVKINGTAWPTWQ